MSSSSGGFTPRPLPGLCHGTPLGDFCPQSLFCPPPKQIFGYASAVDPELDTGRVQIFGSGNGSTMAANIVLVVVLVVNRFSIPEDPDLRLSVTLRYPTSRI